MQETTVRIQNISVVAEALRRTQEQYRLLREQASDGVLVVGDDGRILDANSAISLLLGYRRPELLALRLRYLIHEDALSEDPGLLDALRAPEGATRRVRLRHRDGHKLDLDLDARPLSGGGFQVTLRQSSDQGRIERELRESEERFLRLLHSAPDAIVLQAGGRIVLANQACTRMLGVESPQELVGRSTDTLAHPEWRQALRSALETVAASGAVPVFETRLRRADGSGLDVRVVTTTTTHRGAPAVQVVFRNAAEREALPVSGTRDPLTGLPNRELLDDRLSVALAQAFRQQSLLAVMRLRLLGVERIGETLSKEAGNALIRGCADRLGACVREGDTVARVAPTEFALLLPGVRYQKDVVTIAEKVFSALADPFHLDDTDVQVGTVAGISLFPEDGDGPEALMANAATAMARAEEQGVAYRLVAGEIEQDPLAPLVEGNGNGAAARATHVPHAIANPGVLHYQPVYDLGSDQVVGFEAFLRWQHPELGLVFPRHFLSTADFTGLILAIGPWILRTACAQARNWQRRGHRGLRLAVNLSQWELGHRDLVRNVDEALRDAGLAPRCLQLEVPEQWAFANVERSVEIVGSLRELGVSVCLDGFGDAASSLIQLRRFPVDAIKVSLFGERLAPEIPTKVASAITLAKSLKLRVVAQGVESGDLVEQLRSWQCDEVQGYHWGPPMAAPGCDDLLTRAGAARLRPHVREGGAQPA